MNHVAVEVTNLPCVSNADPSARVSAFNSQCICRILISGNSADGSGIIILYLWLFWLGGKSSTCARIVLTFGVGLELSLWFFSCESVRNITIMPDTDLTVKEQLTTCFADGSTRFSNKLCLQDNVSCEEWQTFNLLDIKTRTDQAWYSSNCIW